MGAFQQKTYKPGADRTRQAASSNPISEAISAVA